MKLRTFIGLVMLLLFSVAQAEELSIGIKEAKPFSYQENGQWKGISVDLIQQLSKETGLTYKFEAFPDIPELLDATKEERVDMSIAAISMTPDRELFIDFSHNYFTTSLGIFAKTKASWQDTALWISKQLAFILVGFVFFLYVVGFIVDKIDGDDNIKGVHDGAWWALVTFTTTGYGDLVPKTNRGKVVASIWMVASLFLLSLFTGYVASVLTVKKLTDTPMTLSDLYNSKVVTVTGSTAEQHLDLLGIKHKSVPTLDSALELFNVGKATAIVHDDAMLSYAAKSFPDVSVWPIANSEEDYAIALPQGSPLTEKVNFGILKILASPEWEVIKSKYNVL
jgi:polar amino acid transport system substrate-binding protein